MRSPGRLRTVEDRLREEYGLLAAEMKRVCSELETRVRHCLLPRSRSLTGHERIDVRSRVKDCESAIASLRRKKEGNQFNPQRPGKYTLTDLYDLAGVRVGVFPRTRVKEVEGILRTEFRNWTPKHVPDPSGPHLPPLAFKYHGTCLASREILGEYQVMPLMTSLYWEVQHAAIYKGNAGIAIQMRVKEAAVLEAMRQFEEEFERLLLQEQTLHGPE